MEPSRRRRLLDPRMIAPIALLVAFAAIGLEIVYAIGRLFTEAAQRIQ